MYIYGNAVNYNKNHDKYLTTLWPSPGVVFFQAQTSKLLAPHHSSRGLGGDNRAGLALLA